jgi:hypothetical protein
MRIATQRYDTIHGHSTRVLDMRPSGLRMRGRGERLESFGLFSSGANKYTVRAGYIVFHGVGDYAVAETELTLSGAPTVYIYVTAPWSGFSSASITFASGSTRPVSDTSEFKAVLWELTFNATSATYGTITRRAGGQDVHIALASRHP